MAGHGRIVAEFLDTGYSRTPAWARRPQAAALVAALADPDRGWDAIVIGEWERAFYGTQYASMAPLLEHYGIQLWTPEVGGRVDWHAEDHEQTMLALGLSSRREIARTRAHRPPTPSGTRTAPARPGRSVRSPRSWGTRGIPGGRCGTGSVPTSTWSTRSTPASGTARCSGGTCRPGG